MTLMVVCVNLASHALYQVCPGAQSMAYATSVLQDAVSLAMLERFSRPQLSPIHFPDCATRKLSAWMYTGNSDNWMLGVLRKAHPYILSCRKITFAWTFCHAH